MFSTRCTSCIPSGRKPKRSPLTKRIQFRKPKPKIFAPYSRAAAQGQKHFSTGKSYQRSSATLKRRFAINSKEQSENILEPTIPAASTSGTFRTPGESRKASAAVGAARSGPAAAVRTDQELIRQPAVFKGFHSVVDVASSSKHAFLRKSIRGFASSSKGRSLKRPHDQSACTRFNQNVETEISVRNNSLCCGR